MWTDKGLSMSKIPGVGVVVGRFHCTELHLGHLKLLHEANQHANLVILLGCGKFPLTKKNPLDFPTRKLMLQTAFPGTIILPIYNKKSDIVWSQQLDSIVSSIFPFSEISLYGSRDSFFPSYHGRFKKVEVEEIPGRNATSGRDIVGSQPLNTPDFRAGVIYASQNIFPRVNPTVDVGIWRKQPSGIQVLLGRKKDGTDWVFCGGFCDPADASLWCSAMRETREETGLQIRRTNQLKYVTSTKVTDWRSQPDCTIMTTFFAAKYEDEMGIPKAGDDLVEVKWFNVPKATVVISTAHVFLLHCLLSHLKVLP